MNNYPGLGFSQDPNNRISGYSASLPYPVNSMQVSSGPVYPNIADQSSSMYPPSMPSQPYGYSGSLPTATPGYPNLNPIHSYPSAEIGQFSPYPPFAGAAPGYPLNPHVGGASGYPPNNQYSNASLGYDSYTPASGTMPYPPASDTIGFPPNPGAAPGYPANFSGPANPPTAFAPYSTAPSAPPPLENCTSTTAHFTQASGYQPSNNTYTASSAINSLEQPTVRPAANFDAQADASLLRQAMKGFGTDEAAIIRILSKRTASQRQMILMAFQQSYGKSLTASLKSELSGDFKKLVLALMVPTAELLADDLHKAIQGLGTNENTLVEILCTRNNREITAINEIYLRKYKRTLRKDIEGDTSGYFRRLMVSMSAGARNETNVNLGQAPQLAQQLYRAGEGRLGTNELEFNRILSSYSYPLLRAVFAEYKKIKGKSLCDAIKSEFSGDIKQGLLAVVMSIENTPQFYAICLYNAIRGLGTNDAALIRIIVTRSEVDLGSIKQAYARIYGRPLSKDVKNDTSGDYKKLLIALLGE